ncbi:MAG: DNA-3-methyladenine glycosylase 2 family protein [Chloroflexi bacterium]|nr:DNA-3-methyladenine glycosylase 2 family protein [Chloroflexota bacterium]
MKQAVTSFKELTDRAIAHLTGVEPRLATLVAAYGTPHLTSDPRYFRTIVSAIVSQQLSGRVADVFMSRLENLFPTPEGLNAANLAATSPETLRSIGLSAAKIISLHDLAQRIVDGLLQLDQLDELDDDIIVSQLSAVRGIGRWTAEMFLVFSLNRPDVWPTLDLGIRKATARLFAMPALPKPKELAAIAEPWRPYRTVASLLLWRSLDNRPDGGDQPLP